MLFDTHCHLNIDSLRNRLDGVISDAKDLGIEKILIPGVTVESSRSALEIADKYPNIYVGIGIHPTEIYQITNFKSSHFAKASRDKQTSDVEKLILSSKAVAVGEIGLDYHVRNKEEFISKAKKESQKELFIAQLKLAHTYKKAIIIHSRESSEDLLKILSNHWEESFRKKIVFHCCEPEINLLNFAKEKGVFIGVDGDVTYKKTKQEFVKQIPQDLLILETDAPFLIPEPLKSQKIFPNEPKNLRIVGNYVAHLFGAKIDDFEKRIWENSEKLFFN